MLKTTPAGKPRYSDERIQLTTSRHNRSIPHHPPNSLLLILHPGSSRDSNNSLDIRRSSHGLRRYRYPRMGRVAG